MGFFNKATGDFRVCIESANQFYSVAEWCFNRDAVDFMTNAMYPFVVNISFACELYIKAIMIKNSSLSEFERGHNLLDLYQALEAKDQAALEHEFTARYSAKKLKDLLDENKTVFIDWRYALEKTVSADISGLKAFADSLIAYIRSLG